MTDTKTARALFLMVILAVAGALVVAGCGGSGGTTATEQGAAATEEASKEAEEASKEAEEAPPAEEKEAAPAEEEAPAEEAPAEEEAGAEKEAGEAGGEAALSEEGQTIFTTNCGSCHTLKAAGTSGTVGPDLDELKPSEPVIENQVINGGGPMPAFGKDGTLSPEEVKAVSTYVSSVAGE